MKVIGLVTEPFVKLPVFNLDRFLSILWIDYLTKKKLVA